MQGRWELAVFEREHRFDQAGHAGSRAQVADIAFDRADRAEGGRVGGGESSRLPSTSRDAR